MQSVLHCSYCTVDGTWNPMLPGLVFGASALQGWCGSRSAFFPCDNCKNKMKYSKYKRKLKSPEITPAINIQRPPSHTLLHKYLTYKQHDVSGFTIIGDVYMIFHSFLPIPPECNQCYQLIFILT